MHFFTIIRKKEEFIKVYKIYWYLEKKKRKRERQDCVEKHHWCSRNETKCIPRVKKWRGTIALRWKTFVSEILLTHSKGDWKWRTIDDKRHYGLAYIHHTRLSITITEVETFRFRAKGFVSMPFPVRFVTRQPQIIDRESC